MGEFKTLGQYTPETEFAIDLIECSVRSAVVVLSRIGFSGDADDEMGREDWTETEVELDWDTLRFIGFSLWLSAQAVSNR